VCGEEVWYYQNEFGSRVFFDEIGWPWPKHPCTDNVARARVDTSWKSPHTRSLEGILEIARAAQEIGFDPAVKFRFRFGESPWDLLSVIMTIRRGFENVIKAKSIVPFLNEPIFVTFVSAKITPAEGEYFGFNGEEVSILEPDTLEPKRLKARLITEAEFGASADGTT